MEGKSGRALDQAWFFDNALARSGFVSLSESSGIEQILAKADLEAKGIMKQKLTQVLYLDSPLAKSLVASFGARFARPQRVTICENPPAVSLRTGNTTIGLLTQERQDATSITHELRSQLVTLTRLTKNLGFTFQSVSDGSTFARDWLSSNPEIRSVSARISDNTFEKTVVHLVKQIAGAFLSNVQVVFADPSESHEFDLIIPLSPDFGFDVEVMDYQGVQGAITKQDSWPSKENLKSTIVLRTMDKARRLGPGIQLVIILRGFKREVFAQIFEIARSRGIVLLSDSSLGAKLWTLIEFGLVSLSQDMPRANFGSLMDRYGQRMFEYDSTLER